MSVREPGPDHGSPPGPDLDQRYRLLAAVWGALLGGTLLFTALVWAMSVGLLTGTPWTPTLDPRVAVVMEGMAVVLMLAGLVIRRAGWGLLPTPELPLQAFQNRLVMVWALQEGGGLMGGVFGLLAGRSDWIAGVGLLAAFALVLTRPRTAELDPFREE